MKRALLLTLAIIISGNIFAGEQSKSWVSDQGDGTFKNPVLYADYSDPDVIRVGDDYFMTSSSFNVVPGLPILHSKDLINWELINHALPTLDMEGVEPADHYSTPQHGNGVYAPCMRYHNGEFMIYWGDPDFGIYVVKSDDPFGQWSEPICVIPGRGRIDPTPLFDDDGRVYLAFAWAASRAKVNSILSVVELNAEGTKAVGEEVLVYDGHPDKNHTIEGGKFYKMGGYYYILSPAGGVIDGWQLALRSESVYGPYEVMRTLDVGSSEINGPHQGALIETQSGEWWFMHFQDMGVYGRIAHLQSVEWRDGWPVMGVKRKGYCGEPAMSYTKPNVGATYPIQTPATSDEFDQPKLSLQWQWHANPKSTWALPTAMGYCRLYGEFRPEEFVNLWSVPNLLLQKLAAPIITATMKSKVVLRNAGDMAAMLSMGGSYSYIAISRDDNNQYTIKQIACNDARGGSAERVVAEVSPKNLKITQVSNGTTRFQEVEIYFQLRMEQGGKTSLYYSCDGKKFLPLGEEFAATKGRWIGGKIGMFVLTTNPTGQRSWMDVDYFRVE